MDTNNEAEKLNIIPEKIIQILLKHLMILKNENAYLKNKLDINSYSEGFPEKRIGINTSLEGTPEKRNGTNTSLDDVPEKRIGTNTSLEGTPEKGIGINTSLEGILEKEIGININFGGIPEKGNGINVVLGAISELKKGENTEYMLYRIFEQGLITALNEYIKTGDGLHTVYAYYHDFLKAINDKNNDTENLKKKAVTLRLEDTYTLPVKIAIDATSIEKLKSALHGYLPATAKHDLYINVAYELLLLHNNGKTTGTQLREFSGLSKSGFAKHLPKLKRMGLIKKQPPSNYVLTETSIHLLLKTFGVLKDE